VTEKRWRGFEDLQRQRNQSDQSGEDHINAQARPDQAPNESDIKKGAIIAGDGLMNLGHRYIDHGHNENENSQETRQWTDRGLLVSFVEGIQPTEFPGKQHDEAAQTR